MRFEIQGPREKLRLTHPEYREQKYMEEGRSCSPAYEGDILRVSVKKGSLLSLEEQLDYHNNGTKAGRDD